MLAPHDLERTAKESLERLKLDVIDLLLIHWPNPRVPLADTLGAMAKLKREGCARDRGVEFHRGAARRGQQSVARAGGLQSDRMPSVSQPGQGDRRLQQHGMAVVAYSPIARGGAHGNAILEHIGKTHGKSAAQV